MGSGNADQIFGALQQDDLAPLGAPLPRVRLGGEGVHYIVSDFVLYGIGALALILAVAALALALTL